VIHRLEWYVRFHNGATTTPPA